MQLIRDTDQKHLEKYEISSVVSGILVLLVKCDSNPSLMPSRRYRSNRWYLLEIQIPYKHEYNNIDWNLAQKCNFDTTQIRVHIFDILFIFRINGFYLFAVSIKTGAFKKINKQMCFRNSMLIFAFTLIKFQICFDILFDVMHSICKILNVCMGIVQCMRLSSIENTEIKNRRKNK